MGGWRNEGVQVGARGWEMPITGELPVLGAERVGQGLTGQVAAGPSATAAPSRAAGPDLCSASPPAHIEWQHVAMLRRTGSGESAAATNTALDTCSPGPAAFPPHRPASACSLASSPDPLPPPAPPARRGGLGGGAAGPPPPALHVSWNSAWLSCVTEEGVLKCRNGAGHMHAYGGGWR